MNFTAKCELLKKMEYELRCWGCDAAPGFDEESRNRYLCKGKYHVYCENCKQGGVTITRNGKTKLCCYDIGCVSEFYETPSSIIKTLLEDMPCFCSNYPQGCREIFAKLEVMNDHLDFCIYREIYCIYGSCTPTWRKVAVHEFMNHLEDHGMNSATSVSKNKFQLHVELHDVDKMNWDPFSFEGNVILIQNLQI